MDIAEYTQEVHRTCDLHDQRELFTLTALGLAGETGEIVEHIKKAHYHGHQLDISALRKEVGDLLWYLTLLCDTAGFTLADAIPACPMMPRFPCKRL